MSLVTEYDGCSAVASSVKYPDWIVDNLELMHTIDDVSGMIP